MALSQELDSGFQTHNCNEKPRDEKRLPATVSLHLTNFLASNPSIRFIRYQWVDLFGVLRVRVLPKAHSLSLATTNSPVTLGPFAHAILVDGTMMPDTKPDGVDSLYPDWSSLAKSNGGKDGDHYAAVMCWVSEYNRDCPDLGYQRCPRSALQRAVAYAQDTCGLEFLVGFEIEFILTSTNAEGHRTPLGGDEGIWTASSTRTPAFAYVEESVDALTAVGIDVQQFHSEGAAGQFEISTAPLPPLQAVDALILTHETIKNVLARHGHRATMYPKPLDRLPSNGAHMHVSFVGSPAPVGADKGDAFLAGLLRRIPALCAFTMPTHDSYVRVERLEAGEHVGWGSQNRTVPVRQVRPCHWELRFVDGTANMYLALAVCLTAGALGVRDGEALRWRDCTCAEDARDLENGPVDADGSTPLPKSLREALACLADDPARLGDVLGTALVERYLRVKAHEEMQMGRLDRLARRRLYLQKFG